MTGLLLANPAYRHNFTNEDHLFQEGLRAAGFIAAGIGYDDETLDVPTLLARHRPSVVVCEDPISWVKDNVLASGRRLEFRGPRALREATGIMRVGCVKDAGSCRGYQRQLLDAMGADAVITHYHRDAVLAAAPWLERYPLVRTWHAVDADVVASLDFVRPRQRAVVSGAVGPAYPLRTRLVRDARALGLDVLRHPLAGSATWGAEPASSDYLRALSRWRVSVATASRFGFALRKIVESAAAGCVVVTDLPADDRLHRIEMVRVRPDATDDEVRAAIDAADALWSPEFAELQSRAVCDLYGHRVRGLHLADALACLVEDIAIVRAVTAAVRS